MTRQHFEALAEALAGVRPPTVWWIASAQWEKDCNAVADACQKFNENFDRERFLEACRGPRARGEETTPVP